MQNETPSLRPLSSQVVFALCLFIVSTIVFDPNAMAGMQGQGLMDVWIVAGGSNAVGLNADVSERASVCVWVSHVCERKYVCARVCICVHVCVRALPVSPLCSHPFSLPTSLSPHSCSSQDGQLIPESGQAWPEHIVRFSRGLGTWEPARPNIHSGVHGFTETGGVGERGGRRR
jgi:hypothetical protein